jgi:hypothetical protein
MEPREVVKLARQRRRDRYRSYRSDTSTPSQCTRSTSRSRVRRRWTRAVGCRSDSPQATMNRIAAVPAVGRMCTSGDARTEIAVVGPDARCRLEPQNAATTAGAIAA